MVELRVLVLLFMTIGLTFANKVEEPRRQDRVLFDIVKFKNEACKSGNAAYNGTCYTKEECEQKGGTSSGECASGYGICCLFVMKCGSTSSENNTYLVKTSTETVSSPCTYTICKASNNICRIRFDFTTHEIAAPFNAPQTTVDGTTIGGTLGDCLTDTFSVTAPGTRGSPVICGYNSGQHMIVDASSECHKANFKIGSSTGSTRQWNIKVTQFTCSDLDLAGPTGCLQYFDTDSGSFASYNFNTASTAVDLNSQHLSNQNYNYCFRRNSGKCSICYYPHIAPANNQGVSFGLSTSGVGNMVTSVTDANCKSDYLSIPVGVPSTSSTRLTTVAVNKVCGRYFNVANNVERASTSICSFAAPFMVAFKTDDNEEVTVPGTFANHELKVAISGEPAGTYGFWLDFKQVNC